MPQPKRSTRSTGARKPAAKKSGAGRATAAKSTTKRATTPKRATAAKRSTAAKRPTARKATGTRKRAATKPAPARAAEARSEERIRELNERIIEAGKEVGTVALDAYESGLKSIAKALESGPGRSDVEWVAQVANAQADILKEAVKRVVPAARKALK